MKRELSRRTYKAGYIVIKYYLFGDDAFGSDPFEMEHTFTPDGEYIGNSKNAYRLCKLRGIKPQLVKKPFTWEPFETTPCCSIGFCEVDQKWYGWSHRAIYGFGVGTKVKKGDCGYIPANLEDARLDAIAWHTDEYNINVTATIEKDQDGEECFLVSYTKSNTVPNKAIRGLTESTVEHPPKPFGKGEWTAQTLDDAKQMASDFVEGVS